MQRVAGVLLLCVALSVPMVAQAQHPGTARSEHREGFVPDSLTAVRIAIAVWTPIYGAQLIRSEAPYRATLRAGVWTVEGSLHCDGPGCAGGVAIAEIARRDGRILRVIHTQ